MREAVQLMRRLWSEESVTFEGQYYRTDKATIYDRPEQMIPIYVAAAGALVAGGRVELRGFGAFSVRSRPARVGRNPRTGQSVKVKAKAVPFFKSGKELRERLNASGDE